MIQIFSPRAPQRCGAFLVFRHDASHRDADQTYKTPLLDRRDALCVSTNRFYLSSEWKKTRAIVLEMDHHECQICKANGIYAPAEIVHHVNHLKDRPDLAFEIWHGGKRNLISVCKTCHETVCHPDRSGWKKEDVPLTPERW